MGGPLARQLHSLWVQHWPQHPATVEVIGVRYPDDAVLGFQAAWLLDSDGSSKVACVLISSNAVFLPVKGHCASTRLLGS
jgi:hypothetical protein